MRHAVILAETERAGTADTDPRKQVYTEEEIRAIVQEAAAKNVPVEAHAHGDEGAMAAVKAGAPNTYVDYAAAKGGVETLTLGLSKEVGPDGIRVVCVRPGVILTEIHAQSGEPDRPYKIGAATPVGRPHATQSGKTPILAAGRRRLRRLVRSCSAMESCRSSCML